MIVISPEPGQLRLLAWLAISGPHLLPPPQEQVGAGKPWESWGGQGCPSVSRASTGQGAGQSLQAPSE